MVKESRRSPNMETVWVFCDGSTGMTGKAAVVAPASKVEPRWEAFDRLRRRFQADSHCAAAAIARASDGRILDLAWQALDVHTNNEAEYAGLLLGLQMAERLRAKSAIFVLDSAVVVGQMEGRFAVNSKALRGWHWKACKAARQLPDVRYCLVPREWNRLADVLAGQASIPWPMLQAAMEQQQRMTGNSKEEPA